MAMGLSRLLRGVIPLNYQSISAERVADVLVEEMAVRQGHHVILSGEMQPR